MLIKTDVRINLRTSRCERKSRESRMGHQTVGTNFIKQQRHNATRKGSGYFYSALVCLFVKHISVRKYTLADDDRVARQTFFASFLHFFHNGLEKYPTFAVDLVTVRRTLRVERTYLLVKLDCCENIFVMSGLGKLLFKKYLVIVIRKQTKRWFIATTVIHFEE